MSQIDKSRHRELMKKVLPPLEAERKKWCKWQWWIFMGVPATEIAIVAVFFHFFYGDKSLTIKEAVGVLPVWPVLQKIMACEGTLRRLERAIRSGDRELIEEKIEDLGLLIHFGKLKQVVEDVRKYL